jgi:hypothetical protein
VSVGLERDTGGEGPIPVAADPDRTEILAFETPPSRWRALGGGMIAGTVAFLAFVAVIVVMKAAAPPPAPVRSIAPPVIATQSPPPAQAPSAQPPSAQPPSAQPPSAQPPSTQPSSSPSVAAEVIAASPANPTAAPFAAGVHASSPSGAAAEEPAPPLVPLTGSLAGAKRYPLSSPDGVAFNLPHAHTSMKLGTYSPAVRGLKSMWVRALPGGGTHLRFFYSSAASAPRLELERDGVRVTTR